MDIGCLEGCIIYPVFFDIIFIDKFKFLLLDPSFEDFVIKNFILFLLCLYEI